MLAFPGLPGGRSRVVACGRLACGAACGRLSCAGHPAVALAAVIGKPDPVRTEIVKAFIVLKPEHAPSERLAGEIRDFVKTHLSAHEYPREVAFIDAMPMTTTGKVIRRLLRERA